MPTVHKPQLEHASFCWHEQSSRFHAELQVQKAEILERSGLNAEFHDRKNGTDAGAEKEGADFLLELSGVLSQAAAIKMDSGFKPVNKFIATLKSIKKNPSVVLAGGVEPEALAMVASHYKRDNEMPGTFWFDVDRSADAPLPDLQHVSKAASLAIDKLSARRGQPRDVMLDFLGDKLLACFLRFNATAGRRSVVIAGDGSQAEAGPFLAFLSLVVAPLNRFLMQLPDRNGTRIVSGPELARRALRRRGKYSIQRVRKFELGFSHIPNSPHNEWRDGSRVWLQR